MKGFLKKLEVVSRRALFKLLADGASSSEVLHRVPIGEPPERILLLRQDRIGDMIMTLPLIRRVKELYPEAELGVVASQSNRIVLAHEQDLEIIEYRKKPSGFLKSLSSANEFGADAAVDMHMHDSTTSLIYALASGACWRLHVDRNNRLPYNVRVKAPRNGHIMDTFAALLSGLGREVTTDSLRREPLLSAEETGFADSFWNRCGSKPQDCVGVNISAGGTNRIWDSGKYVAVCRDILLMGLSPFIIYAPHDRERAENICMAVEGAVISPVAPTILHLAAMLQGIVLLVSPDTSVIHLAASYSIPVVGMYLPFDPSLPKWYPWKVMNRVLIAADSSSLASIDPGSVGDAVRSLVSEVISVSQ